MCRVPLVAGKRGAVSPRKKADAAPRKPRAKKPPPETLEKILRKLGSGAHSLWDVWSDFVEMSAIAISNSCDLAQREAREARYMEVAKKYKPEELQAFAHALGRLTMDLEGGIDDVLGRVFMSLELGSKWAGQFFTPFHLCQVMARLTAGDAKERLETQEFITASDPAVGAGALPLALCLALQEQEVNYQQKLHVTAQDIDARAAHMAYVQLSLVGCPAVVVVGDTLKLESREVWYTPMHVMGGWSARLRARNEASEAAPVEMPATPEGEAA